MKIALALVAVCMSAAMAWEPLFEDLVLLDQSVGGCADPYMADWDGDGLADLVVGQYNYGKIRWYKNTGSAGHPQFGNSTFLKSDGKAIAVGGA